MIVHRLTSSRFTGCDGEGSRLYGGRWNSRGKAVVYAASTQSLAALEILASAAALADDYVLISAEIPTRCFVEKISFQSLPNWEIETTRGLGDAWLMRGTSAVLSVPSRVVPVENNFVLNPAHPDFQQFAFSKPRPFDFDRRLLERFGALR